MLVARFSSILKDTKNPSRVFIPLHAHVRDPPRSCFLDGLNTGCSKSHFFSTRVIQMLWSQLEVEARAGWVFTECSSCSKWDKRHPEPSPAHSDWWIPVCWCVCARRERAPHHPAAALPLGMPTPLSWALFLPRRGCAGQKVWRKEEIFPTEIIQVGWLECFVNSCWAERFVSTEEKKKSSRKMEKGF